MEVRSELEKMSTSTLIAMVIESSLNPFAVELRKRCEADGRPAMEFIKGELAKSEPKMAKPGEVREQATAAPPYSRDRHADAVRRVRKAYADWLVPDDWAGHQDAGIMIRQQLAKLMLHENWMGEGTKDPVKNWSNIEITASNPEADREVLSESAVRFWLAMQSAFRSWLIRKYYSQE